jgi:hypothetical protein
VSVHHDHVAIVPAPDCATPFSKSLAPLAVRISQTRLLAAARRLASANGLSTVPSGWTTLPSVKVI